MKEEEKVGEETNDYVTPKLDREYIPDSMVADVVIHVSVYKAYRDVKQEKNFHHLVYHKEQRLDAYVPTNDEEEVIKIVKDNINSAVEPWISFGDFPTPSGDYIKIGRVKI